LVGLAQLGAVATALPPRLEVIRANLKQIRANLKIFGRIWKKSQSAKLQETTHAILLTLEIGRKSRWRSFFGDHTIIFGKIGEKFSKAFFFLFLRSHYTFGEINKRKLNIRANEKFETLLFCRGWDCFKFDLKIWAKM